MPEGYRKICWFDIFFLFTTNGRFIYYFFISL